MGVNWLESVLHCRVKITAEQRDHVLDVLASRGMAGLDAVTALHGALLRSSASTFDEWVREGRDLTAAEAFQKYGADAGRVPLAYRAGVRDA